MPDAINFVRVKQKRMYMRYWPVPPCVHHCGGAKRKTKTAVSQCPARWQWSVRKRTREDIA